MIFAKGLLRGETSGITGVTEEVMEVLAINLETSSAATEAKVSIPIPEVSQRKRKSLRLLSLGLLT